MTPNIDIMGITSQFDPFIIQNSNLNTFTAKYDGISSKCIAKNWRVTLYAHPGDSNSKILTKNDPKYWYYAKKNFTI
jgi:hypothetical protein